jgi:hypothetical protein
VKPKRAGYSVCQRTVLAFSGGWCGCRGCGCHQDVEKCILLLKSGRVSISLTSRRASTMFESRSEHHPKVPRSDEPVAELYNPPNFIRLSELRKFSLVDRLPAQMGTQNYVRTDFAQVCGLHFTTYICTLLLSR